RDRAAHLRPRALGGRHDLARRRIEDAVIERLEPDADVLAVHGCSNERIVNGEQRMETRKRLSMRQFPALPFPVRRSLPCCSRQSVMVTTTPAPTVLPPSRMAKRCFSSIAIGVISSTSIVALSPGMIISVPAGSVH